MDTNDLKNLLQNQSSTTSLTPQGVWNYTRKRKRARQRMAAVTAVVALTVGIGLGAVYLGSASRSQHPDILTVPSTPESSATTTPTATAPTATAQPTQTSFEEEHPDETPPKPGAEPKCVLPIPQSWLDAFEAQPAVSSDETVAFVERGTRVKLVERPDGTATLSLETSGGKETLIDEQVDTSQGNRPVTDGRFVVYPGAGGQMMVWDRTSGAARQPIEITPAAGQGRNVSISNGQLWVATGKTTANSGDPVLTEASLHVVDLHAGLKAQPVLENQRFEPLPALDGRGQVRFVDEGTMFVDPDGTMEPVVKGYPQYGAEGRTGQILALSDGSEASGLWLHHSGWGEPVQMVEEGTGSYGGIAAEWLANDNRLHNLFTDAAFEDGDTKHSYTFTVLSRGEVMLNQYTSSQNVEDDIMVKSVPLSDLPEEEVTCR